MLVRANIQRCAGYQLEILNLATFIMLYSYYVSNIFPCGFLVSHILYSHEFN